MLTAKFPDLPGLAWNVTKTPQWSTAVLTSKSGKEQRSANWSYPTWNFNLEYEFLRDESDDNNSDLKRLVGFFNLANGMFQSFIYQDKNDYQVQNQTIATATGGTTYQLVRSYGGFTESLRYIDPLSLKVYVNSVQVTNFTLGANGIITFYNLPPAAGSLITADFEFGYICRFKQDQTEFSLFLQNLYSAKTVELVSLK